MQYIRQRNNFTCGPIMLMNIDKWAGKRVIRKHLPEYIKKCNCRRECGTEVKDLNRCLGKRSRRVTYQQFKKHLKTGGSVAIMGWSYDMPTEGHVFLVTGTLRYENELNYNAVNFSGRAKASYLHWGYMKHYLSTSRVWLIRKPK
jgi:hypothetical protein